jgi:hypothetical protein
MSIECCRALHVGCRNKFGMTDGVYKITEKELEAVSNLESYERLALPTS